MSRYLRDRLPGAAPAPTVEEDYLAQGWSCDTLYEAFHVMLYLDLIGGAELRQCDLRDCPQYFRPDRTTRSTAVTGTPVSLPRAGREGKRPNFGLAVTRVGGSKARSSLLLQ
jgi:hypothetical protein